MRLAGIAAQRAAAIVSIGRIRLPPELMRLCQLRDQFDLGYGPVEDDAIDQLHVLAGDLEQPLEALARLMRFFEWDDHTGDVLFLARQMPFPYNGQPQRTVKLVFRDRAPDGFAAAWLRTVAIGA